MFKKSEANIQNILSILEGHSRFIDRVTGTTVDPKLEEYILNEDGVLNNNLHYLQNTQQEGKPNADATTEGQSVMIIGFLYCYLGTGDVHYLEKAEWLWDAYAEWWYRHQPVPDTPQRWVCNWIINGKEPVLANYPIDPIDPSHGGFKGVELNWVNGRSQVAHNAPYWGQYLDVATYAFDGALSYDSIKASVKALKPNGTTDWDKEGVQYDVDWLILWTGDKVNWDGDVLSSNHTEAEKGTVQLQDTTVQGIHKFNFATRNPVEHGGYIIDRNEPFHNRPLHTPLGEIVNNMGNAADGEVWFLDACYLMWQVTGREKYKKALDCVHFTANEYTFIDSSNKFFRRDPVANTPFTEGISYDYTYPSTEISYIRDSEGYIEATPEIATKMSLEQKSVVFRADNGSSVRTTFGGVDSGGNPIQAEIKIGVSPLKTGEGLDYSAALPSKLSGEIEAVEIPLTHFVRSTKDNGDKYLLASESATTDYGGCTATLMYRTDIEGPTLGSGARTANTIKADFVEGDGGLIIGFWLTEEELANPRLFTYRSDAEMTLEIRDSALWEWDWLLPSTKGVWTTIKLDRKKLRLKAYQGNHLDAVEFPTNAVYVSLKQVEIVATGSKDCFLEYYCINELPPKFNSDDAYVTRYTVTLYSDFDLPYVAKIGNCDVAEPREDSLMYCPGLIPFSNIYTVDSNEIGPWHGLPYPGYQAPSMYCLGIGEDQEIRLKNSIDFMYDSQQWYYETFGVLGPGASAFIWDRWDAIEYGDPNTWTNYHWVEGKAWSGYQPRAMSWMCRTWQQLVDNGEEVPEKLKAYCVNWITYLWEFSQLPENTGNWMPYDYPREGAPVPEDDFNASAAGLYLSGCCQVAMAGSDLPFLDELIETILKDVERNYMLLPKYPEHIMNGSFTDWYGGHYYYGFHGSEIIKGIGCYLMLKSHVRGQPTNYVGSTPIERVKVRPMHKKPIRPAGEEAPKNKTLVISYVGITKTGVIIKYDLPKGVTGKDLTVDGVPMVPDVPGTLVFDLDTKAFPVVVIELQGSDGNRYLGAWQFSAKKDVQLYNPVIELEEGVLRGDTIVLVPSITEGAIIDTVVIDGVVIVPNDKGEYVVPVDKTDIKKLPPLVIEITDTDGMVHETEYEFTGDEKDIIEANWVTKDGVESLVGLIPKVPEVDITSGKIIVDGVSTPVNVGIVDSTDVLSDFKELVHTPIGRYPAGTEIVIEYKDTAGKKYNKVIIVDEMGVMGEDAPLEVLRELDYYFYVNNPRSYAVLKLGGVPMPLGDNGTIRIVDGSKVYTVIDDTPVDDMPVDEPMGGIYARIDIGDDATARRLSTGFYMTFTLRDGTVITKYGADGIEEFN